jgi:hypothetical protein
VASVLSHVTGRQDQRVIGPARRNLVDVRALARHRRPFPIPTARSRRHPCPWCRTNAPGNRAPSSSCRTPQLTQTIEDLRARTCELADHHDRHANAPLPTPSASAPEIAVTKPPAASRRRDDFSGHSEHAYGPSTMLVDAPLVSHQAIAFSERCASSLRARGVRYPARRTTLQKSQVTGNVSNAAGDAQSHRS